MVFDGNAQQSAWARCNKRQRVRFSTEILERARRATHEFKTLPIDERNTC